MTDEEAKANKYLYKIVALAEHTETKEIVVVYQALYGDFRMYVRPYEMFMGKVDKKKYPDIIVIQLESFIDIGRVDGVNTDIESIPNFKEYEEKYPSGFLTVPAIGAGTANTEFEIVTGMKSIRIRLYLLLHHVKVWHRSF